MNSVNMFTMNRDISNKQQSHLGVILVAHEMKGSYRVFVMLNTEPGLDEKVSEQLLKFKEVTEVHFISGIYDLLVVVEASLRGRAIFTTIQEISQLLIQRIRKINGVRDTNTLLPFLSLIKDTGK